MVASLQITRTSIDADSPISGTLKPGQLSVEMGTPTRLWVGVPAGNDATLQKLIYDSSNTGAALIEPVGAGTWGRLQTATWQRSVALAGDTMTGALSTPGITVTGTGIIYSGIGLGNSMGLSWTGIPELWVDGTLIGNIAMTSQLGAYVAKAGDTMTGNLSITNALPSLTIDGPAVNRNVFFMTSGLPRWGLATSAVAENGGNTGSPFALTRYNDLGAFIDAPITVDRASGIVSFAVPPMIAGTYPYVQKSGDTMTGNLTINTGWPSIALTGPPASGREIYFQTSGVLRWTIAVNAAPETGSNVGSDFLITRHDDLGNYLGNALSFNRADGLVTFPGTVAIGGAASCSGALTGYSTATFSGALTGYSTATFSGDVFTSSSITALVNISASGAVTAGAHIYAALNVFGATGVFADNAASQFGMLASGSVRYLVFTGTTGYMDNVNLTTGKRDWVNYNNTIVTLEHDMNAGSLIISGEAYKPNGGAWVALSDIRIKDVSGDYAPGLAEICALRPVRYHYKSGIQTLNNNPSTKDIEDGLETSAKFMFPEETAAREYIGLVAQDVAPYLPECVGVSDRAILVEETTITDMQTLDTGPMIMAMVNAIRELRDRVVVLEAAAP